jgi:hypothetical protein
MDFELTEEHSIFKQAIREFAQKEIAPLLSLILARTLLLLKPMQNGMVTITLSMEMNYPAASGRGICQRKFSF